MTVLIAAATAFGICGVSEGTVTGIMVYLTFACLAGEYILPFLSHLSGELFDLHVRVEGVLPTLQGRNGPASIGRVRVFVLDDDAPLMTWVGFRTLMVSRGCYNLNAGEFRCALQEAYEQRVGLRSFILLMATVGNMIFLSCRVFCRCGRFFLRVIGVLIGILVSSRHIFRAGQIGAAIGDGLYRWFCAVFLLIGNLSVYIPYWLLIIWADADQDRILCGYGFRGALNRILGAIEHTRYTGRFVREHALIMRMPAGWRIRRLQTFSGTNPSIGRPTQSNAAPVLPESDRRSGGGGLVVPEELRRQQIGSRMHGNAGTGVRTGETRTENREGQAASEAGRAPGKIEIIRVTRRERI